MHVPPPLPVGDADNVMPIVKPGGQRQYVYDIHADHPAGTFCCHPQAHGNVNSQLNGLMAGALIVVDRPTDFPEPLAEMEDLVLILQTIWFENCYNMFNQVPETLENKYSDEGMSGMTGGEESSDEKVTWPTDLEMVVDDAFVPMRDTSFLTVYVNGQYLPSVDLAVGEYRRLRFVNAIANNLAELVVTRGSSCTLHVLAMDGIYFDKPKLKSVVVISPASGMASWTALNVAGGDTRDSVALERATEEAQDADNAAMYGQALRCQQHQQVDKARQIYQELLNGDVAVNTRLEYLCNKNLATMEFEDHKYEEALEYFAEALALDATDVVVWYQMATTAIETGK
ncbi:hypothetical protein BBJ29_002245 [Phytophthora kernoviae]|uniref:Uncharacterized protein n=1 Tax=Phytophthora kernoviae TaxID=325452 RepID=A0A3R7KDG5_9STRA|nr:hypothetical protein BBJ29_002245 [Phytophthora kernoviae]